MRKLVLISCILLSMGTQAQDFGGKFLVKDSEFYNKPFVFSNRGETEKMIEFIKAYNVMDINKCTSFIADKCEVTGFDGVKTTLTKEDWKNYFANFSSINWEVLSMVPLRIKDSDPVSGLLVNSIETRIGKDGSVWKKELMELFVFDLDLKISKVNQFSQDIPKK
jgi:hypothetical protein